MQMRMGVQGKSHAGMRIAALPARAAVRKVVGMVPAASSASVSGIFTTMSFSGERAMNSAQAPWTLNPLPAKATRASVES
jgi:hypothetical protein